MKADELREFFQQFQDYLAPKLDTYEQAIYLYIFRHGRFVGQEEVVIGFKSARVRMATGLGSDGTPMSESSAYKRLTSLEEKGCITVVQTEHKGSRIRLHLPKEIAGIVPASQSTPADIDLETVDFFNDAQNRLAILKRENFRCFYTLKQIDTNSFVVDHVVSRPDGTNSYRNVVAASREANNRKGAKQAEDFVRQLFREGFLSEEELSGRLKALEDLRAGLLKPVL
jgi:5-methylcytosine-specific restriction endonuclease McrA